MTISRALPKLPPPLWGSWVTSVPPLCLSPRSGNSPGSVSAGAASGFRWELLQGIHGETPAPFPHWDTRGVLQSRERGAQPGAPGATGRSRGCPRSRRCHPQGPALALGGGAQGPGAAPPPPPPPRRARP